MPATVHETETTAAVRIHGLHVVRDGGEVLRAVPLWRVARWSGWSSRVRQEAWSSWSAQFDVSRDQCATWISRGAPAGLRSWCCGILFIPSLCPL